MIPVDKMQSADPPHIGQFVPAYPTTKETRMSDVTIMSVCKIQTVQMIWSVNQKNVWTLADVLSLLTVVLETIEEFANVFLILREIHMAQPVHQ